MDIVERLRLFAKDDAPTAIIADNAFRRADEIERLREALQHMIRWHDQLSPADIAKAKAALKEKE